MRPQEARACCMQLRCSRAVGTGDGGNRRVREHRRGCSARCWWLSREGGVGRPARAVVMLPGGEGQLGAVRSQSLHTAAAQHAAALAFTGAAAAAWTSPATFTAGPACQRLSPP